MKRKITKRKTTLILLPLIAVLLFSGTAFGAVLNPTDTFYVNDYANVLSQDTIDYIVDQNLDLEGGSGAQIVVVTVNFTDGQPIDDYTADMFNRWGIGSAEKNNGVLMLLSIGDEDYYAVQGQGLEQVLTGGDIDDILFYNLESDFDVQDYDAGVVKTFDALWDVVNKHYPAASTLGIGDTAGSGGDETEEDAGYPILGVIVLIIIIVWLFKRRRRRRVVYHQPPVYGHPYRPRRRILTPRAHHHHYHQYPPHFAPPPPRGRAPKPPKPPKPPKASKPAAAPKPQSTAAPKPSGSGGLFSGGGGSTRGGGAGRNSGSSSSRTSSSTPKPSSSSSRSSSTSRPSSSPSRSSSSSSSSSSPRSGGGGSTRGGGAGRRK